MRRLLLLLLASLLSITGCSHQRTGYFPPPVGAIQPPAGKAAPASLPWLLHIRGTVGGGTAFATTYRGQLGVMTAWHVVSKAPHTGRVTQMEATLNMTFRQVEGTDVAFAAAPQLPSSWEILQIARGSPIAGDTVEAWGYPGQTSMGTRGIVLTADYPKDDPNMVAGKYMQVAAEARPGMSGGPVLNELRQVVAVVSLSQSIRIIEIDPETKRARLVEAYFHYPARIP